MNRKALVDKRQGPGRQGGRGLRSRVRQLRINSSDSRSASADPTGSEPDDGRYSHHKHRPGRRRRSGGLPSHGGRANRRHASRHDHRASHRDRHGHRAQRMLRSASTPQRRATPRQRKQLRVCVTWSSPQVRRWAPYSVWRCAPWIALWSRALFVASSANAVHARDVILLKVNGAGTILAGIVHLREFAVILTGGCPRS